MVCGDPFSTHNGTGLTMTNLFRGWPPEGIAQVYTSLIPPSMGVCSRYWRLDLSDLGVPAWTRRLLKRLASPHGRNEIAVAANGKADLAMAPTMPWLSGWARRQLNNLSELFAYQLSPAFQDWIQGVNPQVIYSPLASVRIMGVACTLSEMAQVRIVPHFMDDWPATLYRSSAFAPVLRARLAAALQRVLKRSSIGLTIGDAMAREYTRRFGLAFEPFMNCVEEQRLATCSPQSTPRRAVEFVYTGGLHLKRWQSLREIGAALLRLRGRGVVGELRIYTGSDEAKCYGRALTLEPAMRVAGSLPADQVAEVQRSADCLVHVESFNQRHRRFTRYSISTKIPEYLGSGRPLLAYGPGEVASLQYIQESGAGVVVGEHDTAQLSAALEKLIRGADLRLALGRAGHRVACQRHRSLDQRERLRVLLATQANE